MMTKRIASTKGHVSRRVGTEQVTPTKLGVFCRTEVNEKTARPRTFSPGDYFSGPREGFALVARPLDLESVRVVIRGGLRLVLRLVITLDITLIETTLDPKSKCVCNCNVCVRNGFDAHVSLAPSPMFRRFIFPITSIGECDHR